VLRPIQRVDLPRLWDPVEDFEVAVLSSPGPVVHHSLVEFEAGFAQDVAQPRKDHVSCVSRSTGS
jgi:hypothetical protein